MPKSKFCSIQFRVVLVYFKDDNYLLVHESHDYLDRRRLNY